MKVLLRQTVDLFGTRYGVGLRDIPEGHACGEDWDIYVKAGWIGFIDGEPAKQAEPEATVEVADETVVEDTADAVETQADVVVESDAVDVKAEPEATVEKSTSKKK